MPLADNSPIDAIVVLGAQVLPDGQPGPDLRSRTWWAVQLYNTLVSRGQTPTLITTGGFVGDPMSAAAVARRLAIELGVPGARIRVADGGQNTDEDAQAASRLMAMQGWRRAVLVSHPLHLFRSRWHFQRAGVPEVFTYPAGDRQRIRAPLRLRLDSREAVAVIWGAIDGWHRFAPLGSWLETLVYGNSYSPEPRS